MKEYIRAVIWPRSNVQGRYRYVITGVLVTDKPLFEGRDVNSRGVHEILVDGGCAGLARSLEAVRSRETKIIVGDATDVLLNLDEI